jgi:hypothetical protein
MKIRLTPDETVLKAFADYAHNDVYGAVKKLQHKSKLKRVLPQWQKPKDFKEMTGFSKLLANTNLLNSALSKSMTRNLHCISSGIESQLPTVFDYIVESLEKILISIDILSKIPIKVKSRSLIDLESNLKGKCESIIKALVKNQDSDISSALNSWIEGGHAHFNGVRHRFSSALKDWLRKPLSL